MSCTFPGPAFSKNPWQLNFWRRIMSDLTWWWEEQHIQGSRTGQCVSECVSASDSPWWALIWGRTLCSSSNDFLWYSAWTSISCSETQRHRDVTKKKDFSFCLMPQSGEMLHLPSGSSSHSQVLWPRNCTCLPITDPAGERKYLFRKTKIRERWEERDRWSLSLGWRLLSPGGLNCTRTVAEPSLMLLSTPLSFFQRWRVRKSAEEKSGSGIQLELSKVFILALISRTILFYFISLVSHL